jgi:hypothetical protein
MNVELSLCTSWNNRGAAPLICNHGINLRRAVSLMPQQLYPGKEPRFALNRRPSLDSSEEEEIFCPGRNKNIKIHKVEILPVVLCRCASWSVTLREFEKNWRRTSGTKRKLVDGVENCIRRGFTVLVARPVLLGWLYQRGWDGRAMRHAHMRQKIFTCKFGKFDGSGPLARQRLIETDNIKT